jgi:hypothetical protein
MLRALASLRFLPDAPRARWLLPLGLALFPACSCGPAPRPAATEAPSASTTASAEDSAHGTQQEDAPQPDAQEDTVPDDPAIDTRIDPARVVATTAGATAAAPPVTLSEPTGVVDDAQFVGRWRISGSISTAGPPGSPRGSGGGGAIGWMREYELRADHTFQMKRLPLTHAAWHVAPRGHHRSARRAGARRQSPARRHARGGQRDWPRRSGSALARARDRGWGATRASRWPRRPPCRATPRSRRARRDLRWVPLLASAR